MLELLTRCATADDNFSDGVIWANLIVVENGNYNCHFLNLLKGHLEAERLVVVWVERVLFNFFELQSVLVHMLYSFKKKLVPVVFFFFSRLPFCIRFTLTYGSDRPQASIFFKFFASKITTVNFPEVGTYLREKQTSPSFSESWKYSKPPVCTWTNLVCCFQFFCRLEDLSKVNRVQWNFNFTDYIVFSKTVKIVNSEDDCFRPDLLVEHFPGR